MISLFYEKFYVMCVYFFRSRFRIGLLLKMVFFFLVGKFVIGWGLEFEIDWFWFVCKIKGKKCILKYFI